MKRSELSRIINEIIDEYEVSETQLAQAVGLSQSSINRYRAGRTFPNEERQKLIVDYYRYLQSQEGQDGKKQNGLPVNPKGSTGMQDYLGDEGILWDNFDVDLYEDEEDPTPDVTLEYDRMIMEYQNRLDKLADGFYRYTPVTQTYLLENFPLFCMISDFDMEFIRRVQQLTEENKKKLRAYLEGIPVSLSMLKYRKEKINLGIMAGYTRNITYLFRDSEGKAHYHQYMPQKMERLEELLRSGKKVTGKVFVALDEASGQPTKKNNVENRNQFHSILHRLLQHRRGIENWIDKDIFLGLDTVLKYNEEDWYFLYLLSRLELADCSKNMENYKPRKYYTIMDYEDVLLREYTLWQWLEGMLLEQEAAETILPEMEEDEDGYF